MIAIAGMLLVMAGAPEPASQTEYACTVVRRCSSTGVSCDEGDRACRDQARDQGLEIICERPGGFVYCPPNTGRGGDNRTVWLLLGVALAIAVGGSTAAWVVFKKPRS
jgi:hypothetical protein